VSPSASPASATKRRDEGLAIAEGTLNGVVHTLKGISDRRDVELKRTCQANASEISSALKELSAVQATSADLRRRAQETSASMQRMGAHFSSRMDALDEALLVRDRIQQTRSALATAMYIISLCNEVSESIENGQLYHARKVLITLKTRYGPVLKASAAAGDGEHGATRFQFDGGHPAAQLGSLSGKLLARINELDSKVDVRLTTCLNEWLTQARAGAGSVGRRALELVEMEKKSNAGLAKQRRQLLSVKKSEDGDALATDLNSKLSLESNTGNTHQICSSTDDGKDNNEIVTDPASLVDMTLLLRCVHVHSSENTLSQLLESYVGARQAQLGADLAPPGDLLICHRAFLWQIVGFFVLETRVGLVAPQLETSSHAEASWEGASAALAAELGAAIDEASRPEDIRELKKQALFACDAIDRYCGHALSTRGIRSTLTSRVKRVRATMASGVAAALEEAASIGADQTLLSEDVFDENTTTSTTTKASKMEALVNKLSKECSEYMSGLVEEHELPAAICIEVDHLLAAAISAKVAAFIIKGGGQNNQDYLGNLTSDSDDESWDSEEDESSSSEGSSSQYSDGEEEESSDTDSRSDRSSSGTSSGSRCTNSRTSGSSDSDSHSDDGAGTEVSEGNVEGDKDDEEEELFIDLLNLVSMAAAAENALNSLRLKLLGPSAVSTSSTAIMMTNTTTSSSSIPLERTASSVSLPSSSPTTQLSGALVATEEAAGKRIAQSAYTAVDALADLDWAPESMPRAAEGATSSQWAEILEVLEAGRQALEVCGAPVASQQRILAAAMRKIEEEIMRLLVSDAVPYINVFGAQKLLSDLQSLSPALTSEPVLFAEMVAFSRAKEILDPQQRSGKYASVNLDRFVVLLEKIKDPAGPPSAVGRGFLNGVESGRVAAELKSILSAERGTAS
jgi:hypothetical protein